MIQIPKCHDFGAIDLLADMTADEIDELGWAENALFPDAVPLAVERKGKTDCRECVHYFELSMRLPAFAELCTLGWPDSVTDINPDALEYCGDFVEVVL